MSIQLRQIALVAEFLKPIIEDLSYTLGVNPCFIDDAVSTWGLENTLLGIGNNFIEVVAPIKTNTAAGRYLERRGGNGGYMVICQAGSHAEQLEIRERALAEGVRIAWERETAHNHLMQLHPRDMIASFLEVDWDQHDDFDGNWEPAGGLAWQEKVDQSSIVDMVGVELQGPQPEVLAQHWAQILGLPMNDDLTVEINNARLRFVEATDGRGPGLSGIDLTVADKPGILKRAKERRAYVSDQQLTISGFHFYLTSV
ncbi:MAG: hypothetical protein O7E57_03135 [Gammaproteobacteria bacterium]|nr:hypothetical protein [Gammaproteobacteria bacterium]